MHRILASVPLLLAALALAGCGPTPPPGATPSDPRPTTRPTPTGTPTPIPMPAPTVTLPPEEIDPLDRVTRILVQSEQVWFCDDVACGVDGFRYDDDPAVAVAKLTAVFGVEPAVASYGGGGAGYVGYDYRWGGVLIYFSEGSGSTLPIGLEVTAADVAGVVVETEHEVRVGTPWTDAAAAADHVEPSAGEGDDIQEAWFDTRERVDGVQFAVIAFSVGGSTITSISAPIWFGSYS